MFYKLFLSTILIFSTLHLQAKEYEDVCVKEKKELPKDALLIDVRTPEEFKSSRAKGSINIPYELDVNGERVVNKDFIDKINLLTDDDYEKDIIVICRIGERSIKAAEILSDEGYEKIINIKKGYVNGWRKAGLASEKR
ncbi:MAG: rhodanese-like domain-containing protein [Epsilonproteobacteria bacterium]|nr:rhodanese-like domain-containing protein [Campylobacterota bacterium]